MPHATSMPSLNLQAIILCGPGSSFPTFTANPDENPKALLPIANRPMVWYPIDFCYRAGVTNITLICPPSAEAAIRTAFGTNPCLTSLPLPRPDILAPKDLTLSTGTAAILRLPEVRALIKSDFLVLPCDLVCELPGEQLLQAWMLRAASLAGVPGASRLGRDAKPTRPSGGLGVWYQAHRDEAAPKGGGEETDFIAVVPCARAKAVTERTVGTLLPDIQTVVCSMPTDTLNDVVEAEGALKIRSSLVRRHPRVRMISNRRDAHIYIFPRWIVDFVGQAGSWLEAIGEDLIGGWAKAGWQDGFADKIGMLRVVSGPDKKDGNQQRQPDSPPDTDEISTARLLESSSRSMAFQAPISPIPPMVAYLHPSGPDAPLIRRVDTTAYLLSTSLRLAKLPSVEDIGAGGAEGAEGAESAEGTEGTEGTESTESTEGAEGAGGASRFAHPRKVAYLDGVRPRATISRADCLVGDNVIVEDKASIRESVIGAGCHIGEGATVTQCLLMEGVVVGRGCRLTKSVLGRRAVIGEESVLTNCEVQENLIVETRTEDTGGKLMSSAGLEATEEEMQEALQHDDDDSDDDEE